MIKLDPSTGVRLVWEAHRADKEGPQAITLDMEFAEEGGEAPTPYEVLLLDAIRGDSSRFTRQDGVEETWRIFEPLVESPPPGAPLQARQLGPEGGRRAARRPRRTLARSVGLELLGAKMSSTRSGGAKAKARKRNKPKAAPTARRGRRRPRRRRRHDAYKQSAAAMSPFPPIADYAFLSNCHTGALVAPDGAVDWLCVPRFDAPSVFGTLLDRQGGTFRFAPFGINAPSARIYEPGTNILATTWKTPTGWVLVRDALTMGPRQGVDHTTPHTRPPADDDADHMLVRVVLCLEDEVEMELNCEPVFDYASEAGVWTLGEEPGRAEVTGAGVTLSLATNLALGIEGERARARHVLRKGEQAYCALSWSDQVPLPADVDEANARMAATVSFWRRWIKNARIPDHRWREPLQRSALAIKGLTYMPTGATVAALTTSLPETPGGERNWDYRYTWLRDSTFTLQALHYLNLDWEAEEFMQFIADLEPNDDGALQIMYGIDGRRDLTESIRGELTGYAGARPGADRQRRLRPAPERRLRGRAGLGAAAQPPQPAPATAAVADGRSAGELRQTRVDEARPGDLGGARQAPALRLLEDHVLGGDGPRLAAGGAARRRRAAGRMGADRPGDPRGHPHQRASTRMACCASTTTPIRSTPPRCWRRSSASCPTTTSACTRP